MLRIGTVCPTSQGSSLVMKMWLEDVLEEEGIKAEVQCIDATSAARADVDLLVSTELFLVVLKDADVPVVGVRNVARKSEYREKVIPAVRELMETKGS